MLGLAQREDPGMGGDSMIGRLDLDRTIEFGFEKVTLLFTYRVNLACV